MRVLATYVLWFLAPLLVVETVAFGSGLHGSLSCGTGGSATANAAAFVQTSIGSHVTGAVPAKC